MQKIKTAKYTGLLRREGAHTQKKEYVQLLDTFNFLKRFFTVRIIFI